MKGYGVTAKMGAETVPRAGAYVQSIAGCLDAAIAGHGLKSAELADWLARTDAALVELRAKHKSGELPLLRIASDTADIDAAEAALAKHSNGARMIMFFGTGGSSLGGQSGALAVPRRSRAPQVRLSCSFC